MKLVEQLGSFVEQLDEWRVADTTTGFAGVAQLVEHDVANVVVVGSNPITRSLQFTIVRNGDVFLSLRRSPPARRP